ncbi:MAG: RNA polymerase sigma factor [Clostridia bacterium]|nr:RNA polymerase sigma factor [Clostridia bacterium]
MDDRAIIALYNARDERAIAETADKYGAYCIAVAENILESIRDSEECVNDAWLQTWNSIPPANPNSLRAWLSRITRNLALNRLAARSAEKRQGDNCAAALEELSECIAAPVDTESEVLRREQTAALAKSLSRFLGTLSRKERDIFLGRYYFLYPAAEIARRLGMRENYVRNILSRVRGKLRDHLRKEEFDL